MGGNLTRSETLRLLRQSCKVTSQVPDNLPLATDTATAYRLQAHHSNDPLPARTALTRSSFFISLHIYIIT